ARAAARAVEVDGRAAAEAEFHAFVRPVPFVRAPAQLGRLQRFAHESAARPGVDELVPLLAGAAHLAVALGDLHDLYPEVTGESRPTRLGGGNAAAVTGVLGDVEQRLLDEVRDQPRVGPVHQHDGGAARVFRAHGERRLAERVVGAARGRD